MVLVVFVTSTNASAGSWRRDEQTAHSPGRCLSFGISSSAKFFGSNIIWMQQSATTHLKTNHLVYICILGQQLSSVSWHGVCLKITSHVFQMCVFGCVCSSILFSLLPFEMNSLCTFRLPWGITLIKPNTWCVIAFSFTQNSEGNCSSWLCIYNVTRIQWHHTERENGEIGSAFCTGLYFLLN